VDGLLLEEARREVCLKGLGVLLMQQLRGNVFRGVQGLGVLLMQQLRGNVFRGVPKRTGSVVDAAVES
jgi:hypothetical protein